MRLEIRHELEYRYSQPVSLEPHTLYLKPRENRSQKLLAFDLLVDPAPRLRADIIDPLDNDAVRVWFGGGATSLRICAVSRIDIDRSNPFDYAADPAFSKLQTPYAATTAAVLRPYLEGLSVIAPQVAAFSQEIAARTGPSVIAFLPELCRSIAAAFQVIHRADGAPWTALKVLEDRRGACRDLTVFFMECCRAQGLAARFVSGYFEGDPGTPENELHAWAEVYVEGGGWRGFDPTSGLAVTDSYAAIAAAYAPEQVSPVIGSFRGSAQSALQTRVRIKRV